MDKIIEMIIDIVMTTEFPTNAIYAVIALLVWIGITLFVGYLWNYFLIKEFRETNRLLREIIFQTVADRNKDRINKIDEKAEWRQ